MKLCPLRKKVVTKLETADINTANEEFKDCYGEECMAYSKGNCKFCANTLLAELALSRQEESLFEKESETPTCPKCGYYKLSNGSCSNPLCEFDLE